MLTGPDLTPLEPSLQRLLEPLQLGRQRALALQRRRQRLRILAASIVGSSILVGSAFAAITYLGQPAPARVKQAFGRDNRAKAAFQDSGSAMPLVKVESARTVAVSGSSVLYGAEGAAGNYCTLLLLRGRAARTPNVRCELGVWPRTMRIDFKNVIRPADAATPLIFSGHLSRRGRSVTVRYVNGLVDRIPVGLRGYFVYQPAAKLQQLVRTSAIRLVERDRRGSITDVQRLQPPLWISASSRIAPRVVSGRSFVSGAKYVSVSVVRRLEGFHGVAWGAVGEEAVVKLDRRGRFTWHAPRSAGRAFTVSLSVLDARFVHLVDDVGIG